MKHEFQKLRLRIGGCVAWRFSHALAFTVCTLALSVLTGCASLVNPADPEYNIKLATARRDCTGHEIEGIWVSKFHYAGPLSTLCTLMIRPDGTGLERQKVPAQIHYNFEFTWRYAGNGVWQGSGKSASSNGSGLKSVFNHSFVMHYNGTELLREAAFPNTPLAPSTTYRHVFVRSEDDTAVKEHLRQR